MHVIDGALKDYAWGRHDGLVHWTGRRTGGPQAELWFGAHPAGPSPLHRGGGVADRGLGDAAAPAGERAGDRAVDLAGVLDGEPFDLLVKILAAARPLSIQLHPPAALAERMWQAQQAEGAVPLLADPHEKTELLVALDRFSVLVGLRPADEAVPLLEALGPPTAPAAERYAAGDPLGALAAVLRLDGAGRDDALRRLPAAVRLLPPAEAAVLDVVEAAFPSDVGVLVALLMNHHELGAGDAVFVPAGTVHAYVHGVGVEVMTSSDNVLRLGLTPKTVAIDEALAALDVGAAPVVLRATAGGRGTRELEPAGAPFHVTWLAESTAAMAPGTTRLALAVEGRTVVRSRGREVSLAPGSAVAALPGDGTLEITTGGLVVLARDVQADVAADDPDDGPADGPDDGPDDGR